MKQCGIYSIRNTTNNKVYVGKSSNIKRRWYTHKQELKDSRHKNIHLQASYNKYGKDSFTFEILEECSNEDLGIREYFWCNELKSHNPEIGYNLQLVTTEGKRAITQETKDQISMKLKGRIFTKEHRDKIGIANSKRTYSSITIDKMKASAKLRGSNKVEKEVLNTATGIIYESVAVLAKELGINKSNIYSRLKGSLKNNTPYIYIN